MKQLEDYYTLILQDEDESQDENVIEIFNLLEIDPTGLTFYGNNKFSYKGVHMDAIWDAEESLLGIRVAGAEYRCWFDCDGLSRANNVFALAMSYLSAKAQLEKDHHKAEVYALAPECPFEGTYSFTTSSSAVVVDAKNPLNVAFYVANLSEGISFSFQPDTSSLEMLEVLEVLVDGGQIVAGNTAIVTSKASHLFLQDGKVVKLYIDKERHLEYTEFFTQMRDFYAQVRDWVWQYAVSLDSTYAAMVQERYSV